MADNKCVLLRQNTTAYAPQLWGGDQNITREKAREEAMFHHKRTSFPNAPHPSLSRSSSQALMMCNHLVLLQLSSRPMPTPIRHSASPLPDRVSTTATLSSSLGR